VRERAADENPPRDTACARVMSGLRALGKKR
jgi:hypothetical protein